MEITNHTIVNVCSYMPTKIIASTSVEDYVFEPCLTDNAIIIPMPATAIKEIHSKSRIFADGWLTFEDNVKADMYKFLRIKDGESLLNQMEIMNCIISGKKDDIAALINIKSKGYFERVYGVYAALKQSNMYDISMRVAKAIEYRYKEFQQGIINTQIELADTFQTDERDKTIVEQETLLKEKDEKIEAMNNVVSSLEKQIMELTAMVSKIQNQNKSEEDTEDTPQKTTRGRKSTTKTE